MRLLHELRAQARSVSDRAHVTLARGKAAARAAGERAAYLAMFTWRFQTLAQIPPYGKVPDASGVDVWFPRADVEPEFYALCVQRARHDAQAYIDALAKGV